MHNYLNNQTQYVEDEGFQSETLELPPVSTIQGSIVSGLLYLTYTMDLCQVINDRNNINNEQTTDTQQLLPVEQHLDTPYTYVDDCLFVITAPNIKTLENKTKKVFKNLNQYTKANHLKLNPTKTKFYITHRAKQDQTFNLMADGEVIEPVDVIKLLGFQFSKDLKWENHLITNKKSVYKKS